MRLIGAVSHAIIDYVMVILILIGPSVWGFTGLQALLAYILALALFILTLFTRQPLGLKVVRFPLHGAVELLFIVLMLVLPWLANFARGVHSRNFYLAIGILMLVIWFMTDFRGLREHREGTSPDVNR